MYIFRLTLILAIMLGTAIPAWAQTALKELSVEYNKQYRAEDSYSIIYDNFGQATKIKDFKVEFYGPSLNKLGESVIETYPLSGTTEVYALSEPIIGFQSVKLIIYNLHAGEVGDIPNNASSVLALNQLSEVAPADETPIDESPHTESTNAASLTSSTPSADELAELKAQVKARDKTISTLNNQVKTLNEDIDNLINDRELQQQIDSQAEQIETLRKAAEDRETLLEAQAVEIGELKAQTDQSIAANTPNANPTTGNPTTGGPVSNTWKLAALGLGLLSLSLGGLLLFRRTPKVPQSAGLAAPSADLSQNLSLTHQSHVPFGNLPKADLPSTQSSVKSPRPTKPLERPENVNALFAASPLMAANVAAPLSAAGQLTASNLQMLKGPYAVLKSAYQATGRIGYAQEGVPNSEDYAFGTGFLATPNHVITNRHVHGIYSEYLTGEDCGGIEFIAEKGKDSSDFYEFDGNPPILAPGLDLAIFRLARPVKNRQPIARIPIVTDELEEREIVVIGYPDTFNPDDPALAGLLEDDPVFAVKRISQGRIFRHSTDTDDPYGVEALVTKDKDTKFEMPAICHNASTMTGNSGSPILDTKTGELLGVHFAGYKIFNKEEAANLAMAIELIVEKEMAYSKIDDTQSELKESTGLKTA